MLIDQAREGGYGVRLRGLRREVSRVVRRALFLCLPSVGANPFVVARSPAVFRLVSPSAIPAAFTSPSSVKASPTLLASPPNPPPSRLIFPSTKTTMPRKPRSSKPSLSPAPRPLRALAFALTLNPITPSRMGRITIGGPNNLFGMPLPRAVGEPTLRSWWARAHG